MVETLVAPLRAFGRDDLALAGGKGANLGELVRAGFPVPDGFVVTTQAYAEAASGLDADLTDAAVTSGDGAAVRAAFPTVAISAKLRTAILDAYDELGGGPVAVRSSATAEDLPGAAFAGLQDTILNVVGEEALLDAIRHCWGSLWTDARSPTAAHATWTPLAPAWPSSSNAWCRPRPPACCSRRTRSPVTVGRWWSTPAADSAKRWCPAR